MTFWQCTECDKSEEKCQCSKPSLMQMLEPKDHQKKAEIPTIEKKVKGWIGSMYVESIVLDGKPVFLCNNNGTVKTEERVIFDTVTYVPLDKNECGYKEYEFTGAELSSLKHKTPTKQILLEKSWEITNHFVSSTEINKTLIAIDLVLSYCMEWIDSVHYPYFVGETESGKSTALHLFKASAYRCLYSNGLPHANIYNFYGTGEEACGVICEDECQDLWRDKDKIATYKNSYTRGSIKPIVLTTSNAKKQVYYKTYGLKLFAGENIPHDKGFKERLAIVHMVEGLPNGNAKKPTPEEKAKLNFLRIGLLYWKVHNITNGLENVTNELKNRDQELWEDFLRVAKDTDFEERARQVVEYYTNQRHEGIWNSIDAKLFKLVLSQLDSDLKLKMGVFWNNLKNNQDEIDGELDGKTFYPHEYTQPISQNTLAELFRDKFQAKKETHWKVVDDKKRRITQYVFNEDIIARLSHKYNVERPISTSGASGTGMELTHEKATHHKQGMELLHVQATDLHHLDHYTNNTSTGDKS